MKRESWQDLHRELQLCSWFAKVGEPLNAKKASLQQVLTWNLACDWAKADISWWCANEASNVLSLHLSNNHRIEYRKWNDHIKSFASQRDELLETIVMPLIPGNCREPKVVEWIRSHLTRAYLECIYGPLADIYLVCDQVDWYLQGRFPCGWNVATEEAFPGEANTVVF